MNRIAPPIAATLAAFAAALPAHARQSELELGSLRHAVTGSLTLAGSLALPEGTLPKSALQEDTPPGWAWDPTRPDRMAPPGVPFARTADAGEWQLAYRYGYRSYDGLRDGRDDVSRSEAFDRGYSVAPDELTVQTHSLELLRGVAEHWTAFVQVPFQQKDMDLDTDGGGDFDTSSDGIGDVVIGAIHTLREGEASQLTVNFGLGLPTGSFDEEDDDSNGNERVLPYVMQLGAGVVSLLPGATWTVQRETWSYGFSGQAQIWVDQNSDDWAPGETLRASGWVAKPLAEHLAGSLRLESFSWGDYHGGNEDLRPDRNPIEDDLRQGGARVDLYAGLALDVATVHRFEVELGVPVDEWLDGPQLSTELILTFGYRTTF